MPPHYPAEPRSAGYPGSSRASQRPVASHESGIRDVLVQGRTRLVSGPQSTIIIYLFPGMGVLWESHLGTLPVVWVAPCSAPYYVVVVVGSVGCGASPTYMHACMHACIWAH